MFAFLAILCSTYGTVAGKRRTWSRTLNRRSGLPVCAVVVVFAGVCLRLVCSANAPECSEIFTTLSLSITPQTCHISETDHVSQSDAH